MAIYRAENMEEFKKELTELLNKHSIENIADMPDFLLARMICRMIDAMEPIIKKTIDWHGCDKTVAHSSRRGSNRNEIKKRN